MGADVAFEQVVATIINFIPLVIIISILGSVLMGLRRYGDDFSFSSSEQIVEKPKEPPRWEAERILMNRFAKGDITSEEYTEAMSRL
jgi:uncharacterized membrane protein